MAVVLDDHFSVNSSLRDDKGAGSDDKGTAYFNKKNEGVCVLPSVTFATKISFWQVKWLLPATATAHSYCTTILPVATTFPASAR